MCIWIFYLNASNVTIYLLVSWNSSCYSVVDCWHNVGNTCYAFCYVIFVIFVMLFVKKNNWWGQFYNPEHALIYLNVWVADRFTLAHIPFLSVVARCYKPTWPKNCTQNRILCKHKNCVHGRLIILHLNIHMWPDLRLPTFHAQL